MDMNNKEFFDYVKKSGHSCAAGDRYLQQTGFGTYELWNESTVAAHIIAMTMQFGISKQVTTRCIADCLRSLYLGYNEAFSVLDEWIDNDTPETRAAVKEQYHANYVELDHGRFDRLTYLLAIPNQKNYYISACLALKTNDIELSSEWISIIKNHVEYKDLNIAPYATPSI
jgi:hypothetical protein